MLVKCPNCKKMIEFEGNPHRPFCSERCQLIDLGEWAQEKFAVPSEEQTLAQTDKDGKGRAGLDDDSD